jgi:outer membrane protein
MFSYEGRRFYFRGVAAGYRLFQGTNWSIAPVLWPRFDGYEEDDSGALRGMDDRDMTLDGGLAFSLRGDWGVFGASLVTDILGKHDGQELELSYSKPLRRGPWVIAPTAGLRWESSNLVDYYYGVRDDEARTGRPAYDADAAFDPFVGLRLLRALGKKWTFLAAAQYEWFDGEIADSPIVDEDYDISVMVGLLYSF